jgi:hypothetical protein
LGDFQQVASDFQQVTAQLALVADGEADELAPVADQEADELALVADGAADELAPVVDGAADELALVIDGADELALVADVAADELALVADVAADELAPVADVFPPWIKMRRSSVLRFLAVCIIDLRFLARTLMFCVIARIRDLHSFLSSFNAVIWLARFSLQFCCIC